MKFAKKTIKENAAGGAVSATAIAGVRSPLMAGKRGNKVKKIKVTRFSFGNNGTPYTKKVVEGTVTGTHHFVSNEKAIEYYSTQSEDPVKEVMDKLSAGEIKVGKPELKSGETLKVIDNGTRYAIVSEAKEEKKEKEVGIEAYGIRGMKSKSWRKKFKSQAAFEKWLEKHEGDVEVKGTHELEESSLSADAFDPTDVISKLKATEKGNSERKDTVSFGLEDELGGVVKVLVPHEQSNDFEAALAAALDERNQTSSAKEIAEILFDLRNKFDIVDVIWPEVVEDEEEQTEQPAEGDLENPDAVPGEEGAELNPEMGEGGEDFGLEDEMAPEGGEDDGVKSALQQVIDMLRADAEAREAEANAKKAEAEAKTAEYAAKAAAAKVKAEEEVLDMEDYYDKKDEEEKEAKKLAQLAKYRHDLAKDAEEGIGESVMEADQIPLPGMDRRSQERRTREQQEERGNGNGMHDPTVRGEVEKTSKLDKFEKGVKAVEVGTNALDTGLKLFDVLLKTKLFGGGEEEQPEEKVKVPVPVLAYSEKEAIELINRNRVQVADYLGKKQYRKPGASTKQKIVQPAKDNIDFAGNYDVRASRQVDMTYTGVPILVLTLGGFKPFSGDQPVAESKFDTTLKAIEVGTKAVDVGLKLYEVLLKTKLFNKKKPAPQKVEMEVKVPVPVLAVSEEDAIRLINQHKEGVLDYLGQKTFRKPGSVETQQIVLPLEDNVWFSNNYDVRTAQNSNATMVLTPNGFEAHAAVAESVGKPTKQYTFDELWDALVPQSGDADTLAGELVRAAGRCQYEIYNNGGGNNYDDFVDFLYSHGDYITKYLTNKDSLKQMGEFLKKASRTKTSWGHKRLADKYGYGKDDGVLNAATDVVNAVTMLVNKELRQDFASHGLTEDVSAVQKVDGYWVPFKHAPKSIQEQVTKKYSKVHPETRVLVKKGEVKGVKGRDQQYVEFARDHEQHQK